MSDSLYREAGLLVHEVLIKPYSRFITRTTKYESINVTILVMILGYELLTLGVALRAFWCG